MLSEATAKAGAPVVEVRPIAPRRVCGVDVAGEVRHPSLKALGLGAGVGVALTVLPIAQDRAADALGL